MTHTYLLQLLQAFGDVQGDVDQRPVSLVLKNSAMQIINSVISGILTRLEVYEMIRFK